jgi:hypothetical protein
MTIPLSFVSVLVALFSCAAPPQAEESVPALLQRQAREMADALGTGDAAVWEKYLDPDVRFESAKAGTCRGRNSSSTT